MQISGLVFSGLTKEISGLAYSEKFISAYQWTSAKKTKNCISDTADSDGECHLLDTGQLASSYRK
jgi:hypothetical protein